MLLLRKILFICTGNTCRSIMAEGFFNSAVANDPLLSKSLTSSSAGIMAINGSPPSPNSVQVLKDVWGIDIDSHKAKLIEYEDINDAHLVLTMTRKHKDALIRLFPNVGSKIYTLKEYTKAGKGQDGEEIKGCLFKNVANNYNFCLDVPDPYGMSFQVYKQCAKDIKKAVDKIINKLQREISNYDSTL